MRVTAQHMRISGICAFPIAWNTPNIAEAIIMKRPPAHRTAKAPAQALTSAVRLRYSMESSGSARTAAPTHAGNPIAAAARNSVQQPCAAAFSSLRSHAAAISGTEVFSVMPANEGISMNIVIAIPV